MALSGQVFVDCGYRTTKRLRAISSHGCPWLCTARDWPSAISRVTVDPESCVWQQGSTWRRRQQNRIELYVLATVNPKPK